LRPSVAWRKQQNDLFCWVNQTNFINLLAQAEYIVKLIVETNNGGILAAER
jgi:hypothetical protein